MNLSLWLKLSSLLVVLLSLASAKSFTFGGTTLHEQDEETNQSESAMNPKEEAIDLLRRLTRQAAVNSKGLCKYRKGSWSSCNSETKLRTRNDTLKRGDPKMCENVKIRTKECKGGKKGANRAKQRTNNKGERGRYKTEEKKSE